MECDHKELQIVSCTTTECYYMCKKCGRILMERRGEIKSNQEWEEGI